MQAHQYEHRIPLPTPAATLLDTKLVRFSDVIRYSDSQIGYLEYEDDDICSTASSENGKKEQRWNLNVHLPPSPPLRRRSLLNNSIVSPDPPSPPLRRRSDPAIPPMLESTLAPSPPQRRGTLDHFSDDETEAEDESICSSPRHSSLVTSSSLRSVDSSSLSSSHISIPRRARNEVHLVPTNIRRQR